MEIAELIEPPDAEGAKLLGLITENHDVFSLDAYERGETDVLQMEIDTEGAQPRTQSACRMPFADGKENTGNARIRSHPAF